MARGSLLSTRQSAPEDPLDFLALAEAEGFGDGLPLVPPTEARVQEMLEGTPLPPEHVVGVVEPRRAEATVEKIAVNAVMAGCRPDLLPLVIAAVEAVTAPEFNLYAINTTTCCATPALMVNGPARRRLGIECGYSCLGHNGRANATAGRALRLVLRNVGGSLPGAVTKSTFGQPGRISLCFGEYEERSPWAPFHVRRGFRADQDVVTVTAATGTQDIADIWAESGEDLVELLAHGMDWAGNNKGLVPRDKGDMLLLVCPDFADKMARDGLGVADVQQLLFEHTKAPIERWPRSYWPKLEERGFLDERGRVVLAGGPEQFLIAVAGGEGGHHAVYFCSFGLTFTVSRAFRPEGAEAGAAEFCELPARATESA